jgi:hypothetical protein
MRKLLLIGLTLSLVSCTDARFAAIKAVGAPHIITCYSGGIIIYKGESTGAVQNEEHSDGYFFEDAATRKLVTVSGNCVITVK